jgi:hypothetical protein
VKNLIAVILLTPSLMGCASTLRYHANFQGKDLGCCIVHDTLHPSKYALQTGTGGWPARANWNTNHGALEMVLTAPTPIPTDGRGKSATPSMGIFSTNLNFGPGTAFWVSATFQRPRGTLTGKAWSLGVVARTGGLADEDYLERLTLSLRVKDFQADLRVQEVWGLLGQEFRQLNHASIPQDAYDKIFDLTSPEPFTLTLFVDRRTGGGHAIMTMRGRPTVAFFGFTMINHTQNSGEPFTVLGATLANGFGPGETVSTEVTDFKIWTR